MAPASAAGVRRLRLAVIYAMCPTRLNERTRRKSRSFSAATSPITIVAADMARRSVAYNSLEDSVEIVTGDIKEAVRLFGPASFDVVTSNPPYMTGQHGLTNPNEARAIARHEILCTLEDVVQAAAGLLKPQGRFYMVHRPFRLAEIFGVLGKYKLEPKRMRLVYPYVDREPNMVLIEACRGGRPRITVEKPLIVYQRPGVYTDEIYDVYGY